MELKCYCFGSALNSLHCCPSFPIQLTSTSLNHLFCLCFYLLIVFHIPSIYKLFSPFRLCLHSSAEMSRDMYENGTFSLPGSYIYRLDYLPISAVSNIFVFCSVGRASTESSSTVINEEEFQAGQCYKTWIRNK